MKNFIKKTSKFFRSRVLWKIFLALGANLILTALVGFLLSIFFWRFAIKNRMDNLQNEVTSKIVSYWEDYYFQNSGWSEELKTLPIWTRHLNILDTVVFTETYFEFPSNFYENIKLRDYKKNLLSPLLINHPKKRLLDKNRKLLNSRDDDLNNRGKKSKGNRFGDKNDKGKFFKFSYPKFGAKVLKKVSHPIQIDKQAVGWVEIPVLVQTSGGFFSSTLGNSSLTLGYIILPFLITLGIAYLLSWWIVKPVQKINLGLQALEKSNFDYRVKISRIDEIGKLAGSFNKMASQMASFVINKKIWVATISHELRTPLTILRGEIEAMLDGVREPSVIRLKSIQQELLTLIELVKDLQELSSYHNEQVDFEQQNIAIQSILSLLHSRYADIFQKNGLTINLQDINTERYYILGDQNLLLRAFDKIMENCLTHTSKGPVHITSHVLKELWTISFEDHAPGIEKEEMEKIFNYFYRYQNGSNQNQGNGLGLAICRSIIELHKGHIIAKRSDYGGLKIEITLPLAKK